MTNIHFEGYLKNVTSDMKTLRPTILPAVPRFLNRIHKECVATANKTSLFRQVDMDTIVNTSSLPILQSIICRYSIWVSNSRQMSCTRVL